MIGTDLRTINRTDRETGRDFVLGYTVERGDWGVPAPYPSHSSTSMSLEAAWCGATDEPIDIDDLPESVTAWFDSLAPSDL